jgi:amino acid transporter
VRVATFAANCNAMLLYIGFFFDGADSGAARIAIISAVVIGTTVINIAGVRQTAMATNIFTVGKILPLLVFVAIGVFFIEPGNFTFGSAPASGDFSAAVLILIYAFVGFEAAVIPAGEAKDPKKAMPFALFAALIFCAVLFLIIQIVAVGTLPGLADSKTPLADAAVGFLGSYGGAFISIGALISVLGNLNGGFLATSRIPFAMAEHNELPGAFGRIHEKTKTPHIAIVVTAAVILVMTIFTSFLSAVTIATITRLIVYATTCLALPVFRQRNDVPFAAFRAPLGILAAVLALGLTAWLLGNVDFKKEGLPIVVAVALGLVIYYANKFFSREEKPASN